MTEMKQDVFEDALRALEEFGEQGSSWEMAYDDLSTRYAAAPAEVHWLPKEVANCMELWKQGSIETIYLRARYNAKCSKTGVGRAVWQWIIGNPDDFAAAWLAWPNVEVEK